MNEGDLGKKVGDPFVLSHFTHILHAIFLLLLAGSPEMMFTLEWKLTNFQFHCTLSVSVEWREYLYRSCHWIYSFHRRISFET